MVGGNPTNVNWNICHRQEHPNQCPRIAWEKNTVTPQNEAARKWCCTKTIKKHEQLSVCLKTCLVSRTPNSIGAGQLSTASGNWFPSDSFRWPIPVNPYDYNPKYRPYQMDNQLNDQSTLINSMGGWITTPIAGSTKSITNPWPQLWVKTCQNPGTQ